MYSNICSRLRIPEKELEKSVLVFFFYFSVIFSYYLIKPSKEALFIHYVGAESMTTAWVIIPVLTLAFLLLYDFMVRKLKRKVFACALFSFFILNIIAIWLFFKIGYRREAAYSLYIWSDIFSVSSVTLFWSITNDIYTSEVARKVYGIIGIGSQLGAILGSLITKSIPGKMETENLLLISSVFFVVIIMFIFKIDSLAQNQEHDKRMNEEKKGDSKGSATKDLTEVYRNFLLVVRSPYLFYFALLVITTIMCSKLIDFQIGRVLESAVPDKNMKTAFFGNLYFVANVISSLFLLFTTLFYHLCGIFGTLFLAPLINLITISGFAFFPFLIYITVAKILDGGMKYGVTQVTREMLYIPCTKEEKYRAKAVIDMLFYRLASVFTAVLNLIFTKEILLSVQQFNAVIFVIIGLNIWIIFGLKKAFIRGLEQKIEEFYNTHRETLQEIRKPCGECTSSLEEEMLLKLAAAVKEKAPGECIYVNALELIADDLPELAAVSARTGNNRKVELAILILSRFHSDIVIHSLCVQYLTLTLPARLRKYYGPILGLNTPMKAIVKLAG